MSSAAGSLLAPAGAPSAQGARQSSGLNVTGTREKYRRELFDRQLPFWDKHGIDHELGGFFHSLDYDGTRVRTDKFHWFQGRGVWVYSFLYQHFGKDPKHLEIARKTKDFMLRHEPQPDGWWAETLTREGKLVRPFQGDIYGMFFGAEGLQEYAAATGDEQAHELALGLMKKLYRYIDTPGVQLSGIPKPGMRPQGLWMVILRIATQMLRHWKDPEIAGIADRCVDALINRHYYPDIGLNNELLNFDFSRPPEESTKCLFGHSIETLWMVMDEADRRGDAKLWSTAADRALHHIEAGWDHVYGGLTELVNVGQTCYDWPTDNPVGTDLKFHFTGEYFYLKALWALNEVLIATLNIYERTRSEQAARYFRMAQDLIDRKYSAEPHGMPGYMLFADRKLEFQSHVTRQDNYHPPRQLMLNLLTLERMAG